MDRYIIEYRDEARGDWSIDYMQAPTPHSANNAAHVLTYLRDQMGEGYEFRVAMLDEMEGTFADVTISIEMIIADREEAKAREIAEDCAHERSESMRSVFA